MLDEIAFLVSISIKVKFGATCLPIYQMNTFNKWQELQLQHKQIFGSKQISFMIDVQLWDSFESWQLQHKNGSL
jgi:hypothetical protein